MPLQGNAGRGEREKSDNYFYYFLTTSIIILTLEINIIINIFSHTSLFTNGGRSGDWEAHIWQDIQGQSQSAP